MKKLPTPIALLLIAFAITNIGFAFAYYTITVHMHFDVGGVQFYRWSDGFQSNTMDFNYSIVRGVETIIPNATWGIINDADTTQQCRLTVQVDNIANAPLNFTLEVIDPSNEVKATWTTTTFPNDYAVLFTMAPHEIAHIRMQILTSEDAEDFDIITTISVED